MYKIHTQLSMASTAGTKWRLGEAFMTVDNALYSVSLIPSADSNRNFFVKVRNMFPFFATSFAFPSASLALDEVVGSQLQLNSSMAYSLRWPGSPDLISQPKR